MRGIATILKAAFSRPSGLIGRLGGWIMARRNRRMARQAIELLDVQPNERVLEVGFGPGIGIGLVADCTPARWVCGIDPSTEMLEQAQARNSKGIAAGRVTLHCGSAGALPFEHGHFDRLLAIRSMQLWPDVAAGLREIRRVVRPGGHVVLGFTRRCALSRVDVMQMLATAGFADSRAVDARGDFFVLATKPCANGDAQGGVSICFNALDDEMVT